MCTKKSIVFNDGPAHLLIFIRRITSFKTTTSNNMGKREEAVPADVRPVSLSGQDIGSFAYVTIRDRLPGILTKVIDVFSRLASEYHKNNDSEKAEDAKEIVGHLSKLKNEMQTDKPILPFEDVYDDVKHWNDFINNIPILDKNENIPSWFSVAWLSCECYLYRRIFSALQLSKFHKNFDPFLEQKNASFSSSEGAMKTLAKYVLEFFKNENIEAQEDNAKLRVDFEMLLEYCLWGNKCDLSISAGIQVYNQLKESGQLKSLLEHIISNHTDNIWQHIQEVRDLKRSGKKAIRMDFVLDNAGFELFTDLCFAEFLLDKKLCDVVHFHVKNIPWFVSDTSKADFEWTIEQCINSKETELKLLGKRWKTRLEENTFLIVQNPYWTLPNDYAGMRTVGGDIYSDLSNSNLIIFKGDLNYRKLIGDRNWPHITSFNEALHGFCPAPLCTLRTLKADLVVGLKENQAEKLGEQNEKWMVTGEYAVIQFCKQL